MVNINYCSYEYFSFKYLKAIKKKLINTIIHLIRISKISKVIKLVFQILVLTMFIDLVFICSTYAQLITTSSGFSRKHPE